MNQNDSKEYVYDATQDFCFKKMLKSFQFQMVLNLLYKESREKCITVSEKYYANETFMIKIINVS